MSQQKVLEKFSLFAREELFQNFRSQLSSVSKTELPEISDRILAIGIDAVLEEVGYTWFNRLITIRYFELHQIFSTSNHQSKIDSDFWRTPETLLSICCTTADFLPQLFAEQTKYCNDFNLDFLFGSTGIIERLLALPAEYFAETEVLGWFYQYYNSTRRQSLVAAKRPYSKLELPTGTQLFTPKWLSRFLVENSLGRFYLEHGGDTRLTKEWQFYRTSTLSLADNNIDLHSVTFLDPCCGSGHLLACAFRTFYQMYLAAGFEPSTIPEQILTHNLFGLDIDDRAIQIATTVVLLCAYEYDQKIFQKPIARLLHVQAIPESNSLGKTYINSINDPASRNLAQQLFDFFVDAKNFGSLLSPATQDLSALQAYCSADNSPSGARRRHFLEPMIIVYDMLARSYDVVATNPPYLNHAAMNELLKTYVAENFPVAKNDLYASFVLRGLNFLRDKNSYLAVMTPTSWLFTTRFQPFRQQILQNNCIKVLIQPYKHAFFSYAAVEICAFVLQNQPNNRQSEFLRITTKGDMNRQAESFLHNDLLSFSHNQKTFLRLPDQKIIYWLDERILKHFYLDDPLAMFAELKSGLVTSDNDRFLRRWYEVPPRQFGKKWLPHNKGGKYCKWFGNQDYVINWSSSVAELKKRKRSKARTSRPQNLEYNFRPQLSWSAIGDGEFSVRFYDESFSFNTAGPACFPIRETDQKYLLGLLNSCVAREFITALNPTLNLNPGDLAKLPVIINEDYHTRIDELVSQNLQLAAEDWHSFEASWEFRLHPLIKYPNAKTIAGAFQKWQNETRERFEQLRQNETELNQIFVKLYQLDDVIDTSISDSQISLRLAERQREVKSLLSFFVGWCFGRFSLPAKISGSTKAKTIHQAQEPILSSQNILPKLKIFLAQCYQSDTVAENLAYIAETLGKEFGEDDEATISRYFQENFYDNHVRQYHGLPIYWQIDSGSKHIFRALFYCHEYQPKIFTELDQQLAILLKQYQSADSQLKIQLDEAAAKGDQKWLAAKYKQSQAKLAELQKFIQTLTILQSEKPQLDFDAGILTNYRRLQSILTKLPKP